VRVSKYLLVVVILAAASLTAEEPCAIEAGAFLPETAWNREDRVLQYNTFFANGASALELTAEWMMKNPSHQLSLTLPAFDDGNRGVGDAMLNYRRQIRRGDASAVAARASLILPTRSRHFGQPVTGVELAVSGSVIPRERLSVHGTLAGRWAGAGATEAAAQTALGFAMTERVALLVDSSWTVSPDAQELIVRPGLQFSLDLGALRVSPAVTMPIIVGGGVRGSVLLLVGFEHDL
jgi:hypothetical protein